MIQPVTDGFADPARLVLAVHVGGRSSSHLSSLSSLV